MNLSAYGSIRTEVSHTTPRMHSSNMSPNDTLSRERAHGCMTALSIIKTFIEQFHDKRGARTTGTRLVRRTFGAVRSRHLPPVWFGERPQSARCLRIDKHIQGRDPLAHNLQSSSDASCSSSVDVPALLYSSVRLVQGHGKSIDAPAPTCSDGVVEHTAKHEIERNKRVSMYAFALLNGLGDLTDFRRQRHCSASHTPLGWLAERGTFRVSAALAMSPQAYRCNDPTGSLFVCHARVRVHMRGQSRF